MSGNPLMPLGTLNRALVSVSVVSNPALNVTTPFFTDKVARLAFGGEASDYLPALTGGVPSGRLWQPVSLTFYLLKSQLLAGLWEQQRLINTAIGDVVVITDSATMPQYYLINCVLMNVDSLDLTGGSNDYPVQIQGTYPVNAALYL